MKQLIQILGVLLIHAGARAQTSVPAYKPEAKFEQMVAVYNTNDSAAYAKYYLSILADQSKVGQNVKQTLSEYRFSNGKLKLEKVKPLSATETELTLQTVAYGSWMNILWVTDSAQNYKEHHMRPIRLGTDFLQKGSLSQKEVLTATAAYITKLADQKLFAGNVLIANNGTILFNRSYGNNPVGKANSLQQQFGLASMGKLFTTISILQLADRHKLSLDDSVGKLLPQLKNAALKGITVKQLLTHTSGMGDYFEDPANDPMTGKELKSVDFLTAIEKDKPHFAPGKGFRYSNTGFLLLGLIIEKASGKGFQHYVQGNICKPAGMANTVVDSGAGGGKSTVSDIYNLSVAVKNGKLLKPSTTKTFLTTHEGEWGLGQEYQALGDEVITGHSGGFIGICTELNMYQKGGYTVVILSNTEPPFGHFISDKIKELLVRN